MSMYDKLSSMEYSEILSGVFPQLNENPETVLAATYIITREMELIEGCESGTDLEKVVLDLAKERGSFAGMPYYPEDFEADLEDGTKLYPADDGLSWIGFEDMWDAFEKVAN